MIKSPDRLVIFGLIYATLTSYVVGALAPFADVWTDTDTLGWKYFPRIEVLFFVTLGALGTAIILVVPNSLYGAVLGYLLSKEKAYPYHFPLVFCLSLITGLVNFLVIFFLGSTIPFAIVLALLNFFLCCIFGLILTYQSRKK